MRDKRHALLLLLLWKWKCCCCCCCSWYANTRQVGHLRRSAVKLCVCVCVTYNQLQISGSRLKWLQPFYQAQLHARGVCVWTGAWACRGSATWANSRFALINAKLWLLLAFIYIAKKGCSFISLFPQLTRSFLYVIVIVRIIIMDNQSINNIMRQAPRPLIFRPWFYQCCSLCYCWSAAFAWFDICKCKTQFEMHI